MLKIIATDLAISKGYGDQPALRYSEDGKSVRFRVGKRVYDKRAQDSHRWINLNVKAFGELCARIQKMQLDSGSFVHLEGRYDEDVWEENNKTNRVPVLILTDIEYAYTGNGNKQNGKDADTGVPPPNTQSSTPATQPQNAQSEMPDGFTGFESFGGTNPFFSE